MTAWFGESWGAPCCHPGDHVETPDGEVCPVCVRSIRPRDQGFVLPYVNAGGGVGPLSYHRACLLREFGDMGEDVPLGKAATESVIAELRTRGLYALYGAQAFAVLEAARDFTFTRIPPKPPHVDHGYVWKTSQMHRLFAAIDAWRAELAQAFGPPGAAAKESTPDSAAPGQAASDDPTLGPGSVNPNPSTPPAAGAGAITCYMCLEVLPGREAMTRHLADAHRMVT